MLKTINILDIVKKELIGKQIKLLTYWTNIDQPYSVWKKKSNNVTNEQFEGGNPKFRMLVNRSKHLGTHKKYEVMTVTDVRVDLGEYNEGDTIVLILDNGKREMDLEVSQSLIAIDSNTYMFENA